MIRSSRPFWTIVGPPSAFEIAAATSVAGKDESTFCQTHGSVRGKREVSTTPVPSQSPREGGRGRAAPHTTLGEPAKLDHVRGQDGALVAADDARVILDEEQAVRIDHDVEFVLAREPERDPRRQLHVVRATEAKSRVVTTVSSRENHLPSGPRSGGRTYPGPITSVCRRGKTPLNTSSISCSELFPAEGQGNRYRARIPEEGLPKGGQSDGQILVQVGVDDQVGRVSLDDACSERTPRSEFSPRSRVCCPQLR